MYRSPLLYVAVGKFDSGLPFLAKTFNLNKVKITFPSSKFFELSKPPNYNSS
jgi:hypothetical protein